MELGRKITNTFMIAVNLEGEYLTRAGFMNLHDKTIHYTDDIGKAILLKDSDFKNLNHWIHCALDSILTLKKVNVVRLIEIVE